MSFVYVGVLWDLEHLLAVAAGLALGPRLVGVARQAAAPASPRPRLTRREYRLLAAGSFVVSGLAALIAPLAEAGGPLATGMPGTEAVFASGPGLHRAVVARGSGTAPGAPEGVAGRRVRDRRRPWSPSSFSRSSWRCDPSPAGPS